MEPLEILSRVYDDVCESENFVRSFTNGAFIHPGNDIYSSTLPIKSSGLRLPRFPPADEYFTSGASRIIYVPPKPEPLQSIWSSNDDIELRDAVAAVVPLHFITAAEVPSLLELGSDLSAAAAFWSDVVVRLRTSRSMLDVATRWECIFAPAERGAATVARRSSDGTTTAVQPPSSLGPAGILQLAVDNQCDWLRMATAAARGGVMASPWVVAAAYAQAIALTRRSAGVAGALSASFATISTRGTVLNNPRATGAAATAAATAGEDSTKSAAAQQLPRSPGAATTTAILSVINVELQLSAPKAAVVLARILHSADLQSLQLAEADAAVLRSATGSILWNRVAAALASNFPGTTAAAAYGVWARLLDATLIPTPEWQRQVPSLRRLGRAVEPVCPHGPRPWPPGFRLPATHRGGGGGSSDAGGDPVGDFEESEDSAQAEDNKARSASVVPGRRLPQEMTAGSCLRLAAVVGALGTNWAAVAPHVGVPAKVAMNRWRLIGPMATSLPNWPTEAATVRKRSRVRPPSKASAAKLLRTG